MAEKLPPHQFALLRALAQAQPGSSVEHLALQSGLDQALVSAAAVELEHAGHVVIASTPYVEYRLGELGQAIGHGESVLPERALVQAVARQGGSVSMKDLGEDAELKSAGIVPGKFAKSAAQIGWALFDKGGLTLQGDAIGGDPPPCAMEDAIGAIAAAGGVLTVGDSTPALVVEGGELMKNRKELLLVRERTSRTITLTATGAELAELVAGGDVEVLREANELTPEMLGDGSWRDVQFRAYDVTLSAEDVTPGKTHPLSRVIEQARLAFLELGFSEAGCPMAESAFWDFDALFQPQDHPAREMQDTFYMAEPARFPLPDAEIVERVRRTHEDGGDTGSRGWRYTWSPERAMQVVLRTHMTASSIRAIARNPQGPQKVFSIGRVFRRETVDYKHLPEFYQVDGIIIDEHADFASLLGTLATFCERLGIPEVRFKPDFFPYTEPSAGVEAMVNGRWLELAGSGIFRPEVTRPFGCTAPVLAWGFGLERLAMAKFGAPTIKDLYQSDLDWLKAAPLEG